MKRACSLSNGGTFTVSAPGSVDYTNSEFEILTEGLMAVARKECPKIPGMPEGARITVILSEHKIREKPGRNFYNYRVSVVGIELFTLFGMRTWYADCINDVFKYNTYKREESWPDKINDKFYLSSTHGGFLYGHVFEVMQEMLAAAPFTLNQYENP